MTYAKQRKIKREANKVSQAVAIKKQAAKFQEEIDRIKKIEIRKNSFEDTCDDYATLIAEYSALIIKVKTFIDSSDQAYLEFKGTLSVLEALRNALKNRFNNLNENNYAD